MRAKLTALCFIMTLLCSMMITQPMKTAYAEEEIIITPAPTPEPWESTLDIKNMKFFLAYSNSVDRDDVDFTLHSTQNPEGIDLGFGETLLNEWAPHDQHWKLTSCRINDLKEDTYWVSYSINPTATDVVAIALPDLNRKSQVADLDVNVTTIYVEGDAPDIRFFNTNELHMQEYQSYQELQTFFCIVCTAEEAKEIAKDLNGLFDELFITEGTRLLNTYSRDGYGIIEQAFELPIGHFDDYYRWQRHMGITVEEFIYESSKRNSVFKEFLPGVIQDYAAYYLHFNAGTLEMFQDEDFLSEMASTLAMDPIIWAREFGWEMYYDISDPSKLEYNKNGLCITDFTIHGNSEDDNIVIPLLDGKYPEDRNSIYYGELPEYDHLPGVIVKYNLPEVKTSIIDENKPKVTPTPVITPTVEDPEGGIVEILPTNTPEPTREPEPTKEPDGKEPEVTKTPTQSPEEPTEPVEDNNIPLIPIIIIIIAIGGIIVVLVITKKRK